ASEGRGHRIEFPIQILLVIWHRRQNRNSLPFLPILGKILTNTPELLPSRRLTQFPSEFVPICLPMFRIIQEILAIEAKGRLAQNRKRIRRSIPDCQFVTINGEILGPSLPLVLNN